TFGAEASRCGNVLDPPAEAGIHRMMPGRFPTRRAVLQAAGAAAWMAHARGQDLRPKMGMWVWGERVLSSDGMTAFADTHGIDTLFVYVSPAGATALLDGKASAV